MNRIVLVVLLAFAVAGVATYREVAGDHWGNKLSPVSLILTHHPQH
jgi:hypothetical protein